MVCKHPLLEQINKLSLFSTIGVPDSLWPGSIAMTKALTLQNFFSHCNTQIHNISITIDAIYQNGFIIKRDGNNKFHLQHGLEDITLTSMFICMVV